VRAVLRVPGFFIKRVHDACATDDAPGETAFSLLAGAEAVPTTFLRANKAADPFISSLAAH